MTKTKSGGAISTLTVFVVSIFLFRSSCSSTARRPVSGRRSLLDNGVGVTPPMGWNSWNYFHCDINEDIIRSTADALVSSGLAKLGYTYINIDDCWAEIQRDAEGDLVADPQKFPSGMASLANYVHGLGLKFGIYSSSGYATCSRTMPGSLGYEQRDAATFASWGVDYLKYDNCNNNYTDPITRYRTMYKALKDTGRPIFYSICEWGDKHPALWAPNIANSWRTTDDITDEWERMTYIADLNEYYANYSQPGAWNDPDMLEVGNGGMSHNEYMVHFSLWAISKAPLLLGCDLRNLTSDIMSIVDNNEVIAVNQDLLGIQAKKVRNFGNKEVWAGPLFGNKVVVLFVNRQYKNVSMPALWDDIGIPRNVRCTARDLWQHQDLNRTYQGRMTMNLTSHSCKMFVLTPIS